MIRAIIFDADGVLINGKRFSERFSKEFNIDEKVLLNFFNGPFQNCLMGNSDLKKVLKPHLKIWGWNKSIDDLLNYWFSEEHSLDEELIRYIKELKNSGMIICLATNQEKYRFEYFLNELGFDRFFDKSFASAHLGHMKNDIRFFDRLMKDLNFDKKEVLFWDDSIDNVKIAKEFGINAELYTDFTNFKKRMRKYLGV